MGKQHFQKIQNKPHLSLPKKCFVGFIFRLVVNIDIKYVIRKLVSKFYFLGRREFVTKVA